MPGLTRYRSNLENRTESCALGERFRLQGRNDRTFLVFHCYGGRDTFLFSIVMRGETCRAPESFRGRYRSNLENYDSFLCTWGAIPAPGPE